MRRDALAAGKGESAVNVERLRSQTTEMNQELRVLFLEDSPSDTELITRELRKEGREVAAMRVETEPDFLRQLQEFKPDLVLAEYALPACGGLSALKATRQMCPEVPFIFVANTAGEEVATEARRHGATDFVSKQQLSRLGPAVRRSLREVGHAARLATGEPWLRDPEELYRSVVENLPLYLYRKDATGRFTFVNQRLCELWATPLPQVLGRSAPDFLPAHLAEPSQNDDRHVRETGQVRETTEEHHLPGGRTLSVRIVRTPLRDARGNVVGVQAVFWDITGHRQLEEQLRQAQKIEAVGRLAAGIAHDFNNVLTLIQGYTQLLLTRSELDEETRQMLKEIFLAGDQAARLSRQLLTFSRKEAMHRQVLNLNELVRGLAGMLARIIGEHIKLHCDCAAPSPGIQADPGLMEQLIMNLALNARDAMSQGGDLRLETQTVSLDAVHAERHPEARAGDFVCLTVRDTGQGMASEIMDHLFEPFFTTKAPGRGTGLGLATVYGIARQHEGWVEVESQLGVGTTIRVFLPLVPLPAARLSAATPAEKEVQGGTETVLLVEDEPAVRSLAKQVLEQYGYRVLEAVSGAEALKVWEEHSGSIEVLLTDVVMPDGMTGRELAERLRTQKPELRLIFTSGYSREVTGLDTVFVRRETAHFLEKPYRPKALAQTIRRALDGK